MFTKDTRFKDLPHNIQEKLIILHNQTKIPSTKPIKLNKIEDFSSLICKLNSLPIENLKRNISEITSFLEEMNESKNNLDNYKRDEGILKNLREIEDMLVHYNYCIDDVAFLNELKEVYMILGGRVSELKNKRL